MAYDISEPLAAPVKIYIRLIASSQLRPISGIQMTKAVDISTDSVAAAIETPDYPYRHRPSYRAVSFVMDSGVSGTAEPTPVSSVVERCERIDRNVHLPHLLRLLTSRHGQSAQSEALRNAAEMDLLSARTPDPLPLSV